MGDLGAPPQAFLDEREQDLVARVVEFVRGRDGDQAAALESHLARLGRAAAVIADSPTIARGSAPGRNGAAREALVDLLCRVPAYDFELHIPTKAVLGQAYLVAKINFLKSLAYAVESLEGPRELQDRARFEVGQSVYSKLAEELFISILTDPGVGRAAKARAAGHLLRVWDERLLTEVDDFAPLLESAWEARNKVRPVLGTMLGTQEVFQLLRECRDERLIDYFVSDDDVSAEQLAAFEEFLFGLSHEDIGRLRAHLSEHRAAVVSPAEAARLLGEGADEDPPSPLLDGAQALYTSYKRRKLKASYRALTGAAGPKRTAEEYAIIALLARE